MASISEQDIKKLWGLAAGRCSWCGDDLIQQFSDLVLVGEMAHIIAKKRNGPRGSENVAESDLNAYENIILLCPNHHRIIDAAPNDFSVNQIREKKKMHEEKIKSALEGKVFNTTLDLFKEALMLLNENKQIVDQFGPTSPVARRNPGSEAKQLWDIRKIARIIPNNSEVVAIFEKNRGLLSVQQHVNFIKFREHAIAFERNTYKRMDSEAVPVFPSEFRVMLEEGADNG